MIKKVCIFCGSKNGNSKEFLKAAENLGKKLSKRNYSIIYGGGKHGLMGAVAKNVIKNKGSIISVVPKHFKNKNVLIKNSNKIIYTEDFYERKKIMIKSADIFLVLPGGFGTLDELFEVISLNQQNIINKKIVILNINNYWSSLKRLIKTLKDNNFLYSNNNIFFKSSVAKTLEFIENNI